MGGSEHRNTAEKFANTAILQKKKSPNTAILQYRVETRCHTVTTTLYKLEQITRKQRLRFRNVRFRKVRFRKGSENVGGLEGEFFIYCPKCQKNVSRRFGEYRNSRIKLPKYQKKNCPTPQYRKPQCPLLM